MNSLLDKYKPSCIIIEEQIISHLSFQEFYIEKINRKNLNKDLTYDVYYIKTGIDLLFS